MTRPFTRIGVAIIILLSAGAALRAQPMPHRPHKVKGDGFGGVTVGVLNTNLDALNDAMGAAGYGAFDETRAFFGGLGYGIINDRVMLGGWGGFTEQTVESQTNKAKMDYGVGFFNAGYAVINAKNYKCIPFIGVGGGGYTLDLLPIDQGSPEFHDVLADPRRTATMNAGYAAVELGLNNHFSFFVFERLEDDNINTFKMGGNLRVGAFYPVAKSDWKFQDGGTVFKGPSIASKPTFYASVTVLFGGSTRKAPCEGPGAAVKPDQNAAPQDSTGQQSQ